MKYVDEFRDPRAAKILINKIHEITKNSWTIMEVCGGQTHTILKYGIEEMLPENIHIVHGPGCPVCVTPLEMIDKSIAIASRNNVIFTSFSDMLRIPGSKDDLLSVKASGGDIRMIYSQLDAVKIAQQNPGKNVVFFAVGFETTAPGNAMAVKQAHRLGLQNFSILCSHVLVPPAIKAIMSSDISKVQGFLAAGHVCTVMGCHEYIPLSEKYNIPIVVSGFEPVDILQAMYMAIKQLEENRKEVENQYKRVVNQNGNIPAQNLLKEIFQVVDRKWRGIGLIPQSGFSLKEEYSDFDAEKIFKVEHIQTSESEECLAGEVLQGLKKPFECIAFGKSCTPEHPIGAPMVSAEGACAAYFQYSRK
jgi:hydrogenase expression/formation protein HypD